MNKNEIDFISKLDKLDKQELVNYISSYWNGLVKEAERKMSDKVNYMQEEFGNVQMTQANKMRNLLVFKTEELTKKGKKKTQGVH